MLGTLLVVVAMAQTPFAQVCGSGVVIRSGGSVIVDKWDTFENVSPIVTDPRIMTTQPAPKQISYPKVITLGKTLEDDVKIFIETEEGSKVITMKELRSKK
jgi:hypothetical protein